jgi:hypothetical protein
MGSLTIFKIFDPRVCCGILIRCPWYLNRNIGLYFSAMPQLDRPQSRIRKPHFAGSEITQSHTVRHLFGVKAIKINPIEEDQTLANEDVELVRGANTALAIRNSSVTQRDPTCKLQKMQ